MIIYTIMPEDLLFQGMDDERGPYLEIEIDGVTMQVEPVNPQQAKIVRLISPVPEHYLNPKYAPGSMIEFSPRLK
ncbi:YlzJ-like family protein [Ferviditalea candida]|uniref:YlzJ-like family protein n=1 Tax=Ferviditalea candida TaxID=3108399 RepID=A0ABU5ZJD1_9BACL|nr:YlzJ-like family protein [Paenibacillaceae bacterium T2]